MTSFWIALAVLLLVALPFVVLPLWRGYGKNNAGDNNEILRDAANLDILRDQAAELESDLRNGLLTQEAYEQGKRELQARLLEEVKTTEQPTIQPRRSAKGLAIALAILLPLFSVPVYLTVGNPKALLLQEDIGVDERFGVIRSQAKLQELEEKLKQQPENANGWFLLARSYTELERYPDAVRAYEQLVKLVPDDAQLWASYADVYAMSNRGSLRGEPVRLINKALELDSNNSLALALSGSAAMERGDYVVAITHWTKLADMLPPDNHELPLFRDGIRQAREFLAMQPGGKEKLARLQGHASQRAAASPAKTIAGKVTLSPKLAGKVSPDDTVFIFARSAQGKKILLAALRKQAKDLPLQFVLDDSMTMQSKVKLSSFEQIEVVARVSKSGDPISKPGDLQGMAGSVKPGAQRVNIVIDSVVQ